MPNYCTSSIVFIVPDVNRAALLADLAGPADWPYPVEAGDSWAIKMENSGHEQLRVIRDREELEKQYRQIRPDYPDWMPIPTFDLLVMMNQPEIVEGYTQSAPLSFAKLSPLSEDQFKRMIPGFPDANGVWKMDKETGRNSYTSGVIGIRNIKIGVKWPPSSFNFEETEIHVDDDGMAHIVMGYTTPWGPVENLPELLEAVLARHGAKALLTWTEEDSNAGYDYCNPAEDRLETETFEQGRFTIETEEEDGETTWDFDHEGVDIAVHERVGDPDFE
jgi:hypothetical protein